MQQSCGNAQQSCYNNNNNQKQESEKETLTKPSKEPVKETDKGSSGESAKQTADPEPAAGTDKASVSDPDVSSQRIPAEGAGSGE